VALTALNIASFCLTTGQFKSRNKNKNSVFKKLTEKILKYFLINNKSNFIVLKLTVYKRFDLPI
jgi:hypothetical protein